MSVAGGTLLSEAAASVNAVVKWSSVTDARLEEVRVEQMKDGEVLRYMED